MHSMSKLCFKRFFTVNLSLQALFRNDNSVQSCFFSVCILMTIRPVIMNTPLLQENFMEMSEIH